MIPHYLYYRNGDKPVLVLIHGLMSSYETFLSLVPYLKEDYSLLLVDQRGHGKSHDTGFDYHLETMASDLKKLLDSLAIKKIFLLGHSMGARTALMFGYKYPDMIKKMIIEDMAIHQRVHGNPILDAEKLELAKKSIRENYLFNSRDEAYQYLTQYFQNALELAKNKVEKRSDGMFELKFDPKVAILYRHQGNNTDLTYTLKLTNFPVIFILGDRNNGSIVSAECIAHIQTEISRAKIQVIKNAGHSVHKTHRQEFINHIRYFLDS